jgi:hypothetical protein
MPPPTNSMARWSNSSCFAPYPSVYGYIFQLLHFAEARPTLNTGLLCHFHVGTLQKVQELGQMGCDDHSTPPTVRSYYLNSFIKLIFNFSFEYLKFIQCFRSLFNWINITITGVIICECYERVLAIHTFHMNRSTNISVDYL